MSIQNKKSPSLHTENQALGKNDHVKSLSKRQVKARPSYIFFRSLLVLLFCFVQEMNGADGVDLIFLNGNIYTVNERQPHAEAIAVKKDRIAFIGSNTDAKKLANDKTRIIDLAGKTVVPGLTDSHCHIF